MSYLLIQSDSRRIPLADRSVHCVVTSPPYWGLRDYGVDGQIGLERTPEQFVATMVAVFREVKRILRDDGTCWLNLGDSYFNDARGGLRPSANLGQDGRYDGRARVEVLHIPSKNLIGIPWRVALALQADGWWLRSEIIWAKRNPMPESVTDRPTKSHEQVFLLAKRERYYWDAEAVREPFADDRNGASGQDRHRYQEALGRRTESSTLGTGPMTSGCNLRSVWSIATESFPGAHFATFPRKLVEPCIRAGTSEKGVCPACGVPWGREVERGESDYARLGRHNGRDFGRDDSVPGRAGQTRTGNGTVPSLKAARKSTLGWRPSCPCEAGDPIPATVLDPFVGSGTTMVVAGALGRHGVGCDLSRDYLLMARRRIERPHGRVPRPGRDEHHPLFDAAGEV